MRHTLRSIYTRVHNPAPVNHQNRARGRGPRAGQGRVLGQQVPNRMAGRNSRYLERNGLLAVLLGRRQRTMIPDGSMGGMISFSPAQWFFNVRGVLQPGTFTMTVPVDYYQGTAADPTRVFNLPCPQDVTPLIRQELAKHGRILPTFLDFLRRNPAIVQHYNIDITTGMPFVNGPVVLSPKVTALPIVAVAAPVVAPVAIAPLAIAPLAIAPAIVAPAIVAPVVIAPHAPSPLAAAQASLGNMVPLHQYLPTASMQGRPQKRGREDEEDKSVEDNKKPRIAQAPYDSVQQSAAPARNAPFYNNYQPQLGGQSQGYGAAVRQPSYNNHGFNALPGPNWAAAGSNQQLKNDMNFPYQGAGRMNLSSNPACPRPYGEQNSYSLLNFAPSLASLPDYNALSAEQEALQQANSIMDATTNSLNFSRMGVNRNVYWGSAYPPSTVQNTLGD